MTTVFVAHNRLVKIIKMKNRNVKKLQSNKTTAVTSVISDGNKSIQLHFVNSF